MWMDNLINRGPLPVLEKVAAFSEARHRMLAENIANVDTPGYRTKQLDPKLFQSKLAEAIVERGNDPNKPLKVDATKQFRMDRSGMLEVTPTVRPAENLLFHDGTNVRLEKQMSSLAENSLTHQVAIELMTNKIRGLRSAIFGRPM